MPAKEESRRPKTCLRRRSSSIDKASGGVSPNATAGPPVGADWHRRTGLCIAAFAHSAEASELAAAYSPHPALLAQSLPLLPPKQIDSRAANFADQADFSPIASYVCRQTGQGLPLVADVFDFRIAPVDPKLTIRQVITAARRAN